MSEADYKAACTAAAVADLTKNADSMKGQLVKLTGQVVTYEETTDASTGAKSGRIIISVVDPAKTLPSGQLPIYVAFTGTTDAFINDTVTVHGAVYGNDDYKSAQIEKQTLPRVDARYIAKAP
jgi:hypothetical protein